MSALDVGLLVFLGWQGFRGYRLGLIQSVIKLVGWVLALWLGSQFARSAAVAFSGWVQDPVGQRLAAFVCIVVLVLLRRSTLAQVFLYRLQIDLKSMKFLYSHHQIQRHKLLDIESKT